MIQNNLIGFCVGVRDSFDALAPISATEFGELTKQFEEAFKSIDASRVNLGRYRRELSRKFISGIATFKSYTDLELLSHFNELIAQ